MPDVAGIEAVECAAMEDFYSAAPPVIAAAFGISTRPLDDGVVAICSCHSAERVTEND